MYGARKLANPSVILAGLVLSVASVSGGGDSASATSSVTVTVEPFVVVTPETTTVNVSVSNSGLFSVTSIFHVRANSASVGMSAAATALYPAGGPASPIAVHIPSGAVIAPDSAPETRAVFVEDTMLDTMPAKSTRFITFQSGKANRFNQDVRVTVTWDQSDPARPAGMYQGKVKLTALIMP